MLVLWLPPCIIDRLRNSVPGECKWEPALNPIFVIIVATLGHHGSCVVLLFCYVRVFICMRNQSKVGIFSRKKIDAANASIYQTTVVTTIANSDPSQIAEPSGSKPPETHATLKPAQSNCRSVPDNKTVEKRENKMTRRRRDLKVFVTLSYIVIGYIICWVPFHFVFDISCIKDSLVPETIFTITFWMTYVNSTINPILYNFSSQEFRQAFRKILSRRCEN